MTTGSADHGLRTFDLKTGKFRRELFNKRYGHKEWVVTCAYLNDGRLISGGMDNTLCLWKKNSVACDHIKGHEASISQVMVDENNICLSASYDCMINVWNLDYIETVQQLYGPHKNAILEMDWNNSLVVSGDKSGVVAFWDINAGRHFKQIQSHGGGVGSINMFSDHVSSHLIVTTGLKDGMVNVYDMRTNMPVFSQRMHAGAINSTTIDMSGNCTFFLNLSDYLFCGPDLCDN